MNEISACGNNRENTVELIMNWSQIQFSHKKYSSQSFEFMFINWQLIAFL